MYKDT
jgi:hypothetical protein